MNIDKKALKSIVDEIEASRARQKGETELQREIIKRAKAHQLDAKAIRIVLQRRAMGDTKRDEQDYYVHAYELALGGKKAAMEALENGATIREAAAAGGISTGAAGNLAALVQKSSFVDTPHDPTTGEITETEDGSLRASEQAPALRGAAGSSSPNTSCGGVESRHATSRQAPADTMAAGSGAGFESPEVHGTAGLAPGPHDTSDDDLTLPAFLDRRQKVAA